MNSISEIVDLLLDNERSAARSINMVPSEAAFSGLAKLPLVLDVYHRYFFNLDEEPDQWDFRGAQEVCGLETRGTTELLREFLGARFINTSPLSGLNAMGLVFATLGEPGASVFTVAQEQGGHYATESLAARLGYQVHTITGPDPHTIDFEGLETNLRTVRPTLVYVDQSNCLFPLDVERLVRIVRRASPTTKVHVDGSHWMGLILGGQLPNPLEAGADSMGGSTHKTFPGPQKAILATNREDIAERLGETDFYWISSTHFASIVSLGIALLEFKQCGGREYARRIVENTKTFGRLLHGRGIAVAAENLGFSAGHQLWMKTDPIEAREASDRLYAAGIRVNALDHLPGIEGTAIRVGLNEATYRGLTETDLPELADIFAGSVFAHESAASLADRTAALRNSRISPFGFAAADPALAERAARGAMQAVMSAGPWPEPVLVVDSDAGERGPARGAASSSRRPG